MTSNSADQNNKPSTVSDDAQDMGRKLRDAIDRGLEDAAVGLIQQGASLNCHDKSGLYAIHSAIIKDMKNVVVLILDRDEAQANRPTKNQSQTLPLEVAALNERALLAQLLLSRGAKIDGVNARGETALFAATTQDDAGVLNILLTNGAALDVRDENGDRAVDKCNKAIVEFKKRGNDPYGFRKFKVLTANVALVGREQYMRDLRDNGAKLTRHVDLMPKIKVQFKPLVEIP